MYSKFRSPSKCLSRIQKYRVSMCFDRLWNSGFVASLTAPMLSHFKTGTSLLAARSLKSLFSQIRSLAASLAAIISASVVDRAIHFCVWLRQVMAPPANLQTTPDVERRVSTSCAEFALLNDFSLLGPSLRYRVPSFRVPYRYQNFLTLFQSSTVAQST